MDDIFEASEGTEQEVEISEESNLHRKVNHKKTYPKRNKTGL